ncbi:alpha/beta hydrolase [Aquirufa regiilacus]
MKETLVFVHGMCHGAWCWERYFIPYFEELGYTCLAINLPGHAEAGSSKSISYSLNRYVKALEELVDSLDEAPILIGHSMGGMVVQRYLKTGRCKKAVLLASVPPQGVLFPSLRVLSRYPRTIPYLFQANLLGAFKQYPQLFFNEKALAEQYLPDLCAESFVAYLGLFLPVSHQIKCPVLVIGGSEDGLISVEEFQQTAKHYRADLEIIAGGSHGLMLDETRGEVMEWMKGWLTLK